MTQRKFTRQQLRAIYFKNFGRFPEQARDPHQKKEEKQIVSLINLNKKDDVAVKQFKEGDIGIATLIAQRKKNQQDRKRSIREFTKLKDNG